MLSLSDATKFESLGDKAVTRFRPWWEVLTFYCLNGLLMAVLFALAGITISGTYSIWCFPLGNDTQLDYTVMNYASSRCSRIFEGSYLIYFPYWMFLEWAMFFVVHLLWFKLPATFFLFQQLSEVFSEFSTIKPVEYNTKKRILRGYAGLSSKLTGLHLRENKETKQKIRNLVDRLMEIVQENNHLVFMYTVKATFLCVSNAVALIVLVWWLYGRHWHASFPCDLSNHIPLIYEDLTCSLPAAPFLYGLMICNIIFGFCICLCNMFALKWVATFRISTYSHYKNAFEKWTSLSQQMGFLDLCFCLDLTSCTTKDGKILGDIIYSSLKLYQKSDKHKSHVELMQDINKKAKFSSKFYQGEVIASELGLKILEGKMTDDCLFTAIAKVMETETAKVCHAIIEELTTNMYVYKDLVDRDINCPVFEECIELIQEQRKTPKEFHHYAIMAACNAFKVNILVLAASAKCWYYMATDNGTLASVPTGYLFFVHPSYYTAVVDMPNQEDKHGNRQVFISDTTYRQHLQSKAKTSWEDNGKKIYQKAMKALNPQVIPYGKSSVPPPKRPTNILTDLFNETGQKISIQILSKIYIPGLTKKQL